MRKCGKEKFSICMHTFCEKSCKISETIRQCEQRFIEIDKLWDTISMVILFYKKKCPSNSFVLTTTRIIITLRGSSVGQALGLLPNGHQFESPQGHWRFTRSLTSGPRGISRGARKLARTSTVIKKK